MADPLKIGIIGAGKMTVKRHLPALVKLREEGLCELVVITDLNSEAAATAAVQFNVADVAADADILVARDDIDAVCIFAPAAVHFEYGKKALQNGKHLFIEKPPAPTTAELLELISVQQQTDLVAVAGLNRRFQRNIEIIKEHLDADSILTAEAVFHKASAGQKAPFGMSSWLGVSAIHALDTLCFVIGQEPTALYTVKNGGDSDENFSAILEWGHRHAIFTANNSAGCRLERYAFHGYGLSMISEGKTLTLERENGDIQTWENLADSNGGIYEEFKAFVGAVDSGAKPIHNLSDVISSLYLVEQIEAGYQGPLDWSFIKEVSSVETVTVAAAPFKVPSKVDQPLALVLNPSAMASALPAIKQSFGVVSESELTTMDEATKKRVVAIFTGGPGAIPPTTDMFNELPNLSVVGVLGASVKKWGGDEAIKRGIALINTADTYANAVAEFILMQALVGLRRASQSHEAIRADGWGFGVEESKASVKESLKRVARVWPVSILKPFLKRLVKRPSSGKNVQSKKLSTLLQGKTIGIIGWGEITKAVAPLFLAHGCRVLVYSGYLSTEEASMYGVELATKADVLRADVVSMQRGLSARTEKSFGSVEINVLRPGTVFINSGRAGLVDTKALITRLEKGDIFACLDVFDEEPPARNDPLRQLPNVFLTAHIAGSVHHVAGLEEAASRHLAEKIVAYLAGDTSVVLQGSEHLANMT